MNNKLMKLLMDKKVAGAYQYYISCAYKLHFAEVSLEALKNVVAAYGRMARLIYLLEKAGLLIHAVHPVFKLHRAKPERVLQCLFTG
ncbi:hypothetical protein [Caproiciproducens sp.]|uniref:hypothetical protein n=1 Tax=Caproiciproducens sp. TaxID=1954376 RepID=UPI00289ACAC8|nr:hypothetical protein [Caproiciproducens sp.]